jgi:hypothetical protein
MIEKLVVFFDKSVSESEFFKIFFLKKWFIDFDTGLSVILVLPIDLSVLVNFNHYDGFIGFGTDLLVILIDKPLVPIFDFSRTKFLTSFISNLSYGERFSKPYLFFNPSAALFSLAAALL